MSIVTGTEPVEHGISGNFYLVRETSEPLNDAYAERGAVGGLRSHEIFDFAINGTA